MAEKTYKAKKLPGLLKKSYSEKDLENKIYKKIFVDADKALIEPLFKVDPKSEGKKVVKYKIPSDTEIAKFDFNRLKKIAKDIKAQGSRFKAVPFIAVACVIAAIGISVTLFKNVVVKNVLKNAMESVFEAKCDIAKVDVRIFGAKIEIDGIQQANKSSPMKNIFEIGKIDLDFNLTQLLRGRFDAENLEVSGVAIGTERKTDGTLPPKKVKAQKEKQKKEAVKNDEAGFFDELSKKSGSAAETSISALFDSINQYNPETVFNEVKEKLQTPAVAKETEATVSKFVDTYKEMPEKVETQVASFKNSAQELSKLKTSSLKTPEDIKSAIEKVTKAIDDGKKAKEFVETTVKDVKNDAEKAKTLSEKIAEAVKNDTNLMKEKAGMYINFSFDDASRILTGAMDAYLYEMLGNYYPYVQKAINAAKSSKSSDKDAKKEKSEKAKKEKKQKKQYTRLPGRNVTWRRDTVPTFLIERAFASGPAFEAKITELSNDMEKRGKPAFGTCSFSVGGTKHNADFTVDARTSSIVPLVSGNYSGSGIPLKMDFASKNQGGQGVPSFSGDSKITASFAADDDFSFSIGGKLLMNPLKITATAFDNKKINDLYQTAISSIKSMDLGLKINFEKENGLRLSIDSDVDKQVGKALKATLEKEISALQKEVTDRIQSELDGYTKGANIQLSQFSEITSAIGDKERMVETLNAQMEAKKKELEDALKNAAKAAATKAANEAASKAADAVKDKLPSNLPKLPFGR